MPVPVSADRDADKFAGLRFRMGINVRGINVDGLRGNVNGPALGHGIAGIDDQIDENLLDHADVRV